MALADGLHDLVEIPLQDRAHRRQLVSKAALLDDLEALCHICAQGLSHTYRHDAELRDHDGITFGIETLRVYIPLAQKEQ